MIYLILLFIAVAVTGTLGDIYTTRRNNSVDVIYEKNSRYRLPNGRCDVPKLIREKFLLLAAATVVAVCFGFIFPDEVIFGWLMFLVIGGMNWAVAYNNHSLWKRYKNVTRGFYTR